MQVTQFRPVRSDRATRSPSLPTKRCAGSMSGCVADEISNPPEPDQALGTEALSVVTTKPGLRRRR